MHSIVKKRLVCLLYALCLTSPFLFSQAEKNSNFYLLDSIDPGQLIEYDKNLLDSILTIYHKSDQDTIKMYALSMLAEKLGDEKLWPRYNDLLLKKSSEKNAKAFLDFRARAYNNLAYYYEHYKNDIHSALIYNYKALDLRKKIKDKQGVALSLNNIAYIYQNVGDINKAISFHLKALKIREEINNLSDIAYSLNNLGSIYLKQDEFDKAIEFYSKAMRIRKKIGDKKGLAESYHNQANVHLKTHDFDKAIHNFRLSLDIANEIGEKRHISVVENQLGSVYLDILEKNRQSYAPHEEDSLLNLALDHFNNSKKINDLIGEKWLQAKTLNNLGNAHYLKKDYPQAIRFTEKALAISKEIGFPENIRDCSGLLYKLYKQNNKYEQALEMHVLYTVMKDSIQNEATRKNAFKSQMQYSFDKKESLIRAQQDKEKAVLSAEKRRQQLIIYGISAGLLLMVAIAIVIFKSLQNNRKKNKIITYQKELVEEKQKEILDSISYAKRIQSAILPQDKLIKERLPESFILYKPKDIVAGDFYWFETVGDLVFFAAADCTGHGVPGALVSVVCHNALNRSLKEYSLIKPADILDKTREIVVAEFEKSDEDVKDGMDISLCVLNQKNLTLSWAGAHNPLWILRNKEIIEYKADKQPIGKFAYAKAFTNHEIQLLENDVIFIATDGFQDQFGGEKGKKFKASQMKELLISNADKSITDKEKILHSAFDDWKKEVEQVDDVCVIGVRL